MFYRIRLPKGRIVILCSLLFPILSSLHAARWRDITPEEFAQKEPLVDPDYGAEIIFSETTLHQQLIETGTTGSFQTYNRIKVFNEKGVEELANFELTYSKGREIRRVEGRTIKPDGTIIKLEKEDIFDQEVIRKGRSNIRATSFAFPNLEPGDIIELQYSQRSGNSAYFVEVDFLNNLPAQRVNRKITPFNVSGIGSKIIWYNMPGFEGKPNRGTWEFELTNLPAKIDEPYSLPDLHIGPYVVLYYYNSEPREKVYWAERSKELYKEGRRRLKPSKDIEEFVAKHTAKTKTLMGQLNALYQYCQHEIKNHEYSYGVYTSKELEDLPTNDNPHETFTRGHGTPENINALFGGMARALGLKAELATTNDIRKMVFREGSKVSFALRDEVVALEIEGEWKFFNPGMPFLRFNALEWFACGSKALIGDRKGAPLTLVPMPGADFPLEPERESSALMSRAI
jgi:hypothetical protein